MKKLLAFVVLFVGAFGIITACTDLGGTPVHVGTHSVSAALVVAFLTAMVLNGGGKK